MATTIKKGEKVTIAQSGNDLILITAKGNYPAADLPRLLNVFDMDTWFEAKKLLKAVEKGEKDIVRQDADLLHSSDGKPKLGDTESNSENKAEGNGEEEDNGEVEAEGNGEEEDNGEAEAEGNGESEADDGEEEAKDDGEDESDAEAEDDGGEEEDGEDGDRKIKKLVDIVVKIATPLVCEKSQGIVCDRAEGIVAAKSLPIIRELAKELAGQGPADEESAKNSAAQLTIENLKKAIGDYVAEEIARNGNAIKITKEIVVNIDGVKRKLEGQFVHPKFDAVFRAITANIPVYMFGPAGTGKSILAGQVADALNLPCYYTGRALDDFTLTGCVDAKGVFHETPFYKAFKDGGVFFLDELDASDPNALVILNEALANGRASFANSPEMVKAHPNFRVITAGNTLGNCRDAVYTGRNPLDGATLNRFVKIPIDYDRKLELALVNGDEQLVDFAEAVRYANEKEGMDIICSYRNTTNIKKLMAAGMPVIEAMGYCLLNDTEIEKARFILSALNIKMRGTKNVYHEAFKSAVMEEIERRAA